MHRLSVRLQLACGERSFDELHLQRGLYWTGWWRMHSVCCRKVQGIDRTSRVQRLCSRDLFGIDWSSSSVHELRDRDVFDNSRGRCKFDMCHLSVRHQLT